MIATHIALIINALTSGSSFDEYYYRQARYDRPKGARASYDMAILHEVRKSHSKETMGRGHRYLTSEDVDYISKLHEHIENTWDGTAYKFEDKDVIIMKKTFDKKWLKDNKKIPNEYTEEYSNRKGVGHLTVIL